MVFTHPFLLEHLVWCCLDMAITRPGAEKTIDISLDTKEKGVDITFSGLNDLSRPTPVEFPGPRENGLMQVLDAQMELYTTDGRIRIEIPKKSKMDAC